MELILLAGLNLAALPMILLYVLIIVLFLFLLYVILNAFPPTKEYARTIVLIVGGLMLLLFLISLVGVRVL
jgi:hypothetical protein